MTVVKNTIEDKLRDGLAPEHLEVFNESHQHNVPPGSESHFKVVVVAEGFTGQTKVKRHQAVYRLLNEELAGGVHALSMHLYSPDEWRETTAAPDSPPCLGGGS